MAPQRKHIASLGDRFGRLKVVSSLTVRYDSGRPNGYVECECDCGTRSWHMPKSLRLGKVKSCGCLKHDAFPERTRYKKKHGEAGNPTPEYRTWISMRERCTDPKSASYFRYGACGIKVCERWATSYENFLADMGRKPSPQHTIDRIDGLKDYSPENCKWSTKREQAQNRSSTVMFTLNGETKPAIEWARALGLHKSTIFVRMRNGWSLNDALTKPSLLPRGITKHGTRMAYSVRKCRCDICRAAMAKRARDYRKRLSEVGV